MRGWAAAVGGATLLPTVATLPVMKYYGTLWISAAFEQKVTVSDLVFHPKPYLVNFDPQ